MRSIDGKSEMFENHSNEKKELMKILQRKDEKRRRIKKMEADEKEATENIERKVKDIKEEN